MQIIRIIAICCCILMCGAAVLAESGERSLDTDQMISELEKHIELSKEQWEKLKPVLEEKSKEMQQSLNESVDKGYAELDELSKKLEAMSEDAERKAKELMSSEEVQKMREYLSKIDEDAIREARDKMVAELTELLELTEAQVAKIGPVLEDGIMQLSVMLQQLARDGNRSWEAFKEQFDQLMEEMKEKLQGSLDNKQMERLEEYNDEQEEKIRKTLFTV